MSSIGSPPVRFGPRAAGRTAARALAWVKVVLVRGRLDAVLAAGGDPETDPALVRRSRRLTSARYRRRLAVSVERLVEEIEAGAGLSSAVPVRREQVAEARGTLLSIAGALRDVDPVGPRGVALTLRLITDPASPLYSGTSEALKHKAREALDHLLAGSHPWSELPAAPPLPSGRSLHDHA